VQNYVVCALHFFSSRSIQLWSFKSIALIVFEVCPRQTISIKLNKGQCNNSKIRKCSYSLCALQFLSLRHIHLGSFKAIAIVVFDLWTGRKCDGRTPDGQSSNYMLARRGTLKIKHTMYSGNLTTYLCITLAGHSNLWVVCRFLLLCTSVYRWSHCQKEMSFNKFHHLPSHSLWKEVFDSNKWHQ
jgi:hypothetical protein